jgi:hypothetical protein
MMDKPENAAGESAGAETQAAQPQAQQPMQQRQVQVNDSKAIAAYANFCRVTGTPEELIIDFGLNDQPMGMPESPIEITQRIVVNFFTAKRLLNALGMSVQRHEGAFGVLETDVQKRVLPSAFRQQPQQQNR